MTVILMRELIMSHADKCEDRKASLAVRFGAVSQGENYVLNRAPLKSRNCKLVALLCAHSFVALLGFV